MSPKPKSLEERFWPKVDVREEDDCWPWTAGSDKNGYGSIRDSGKSHSQKRAHRVSWELHNGPIPGGLCVLHHCDTTGCVNPGHLFLGTLALNNADRAGKGRSGGFVCLRGGDHTQAVLTEQDVKLIKQYLALPRGRFWQRTIGKLFGVHRITINDIKTGRTWSHICQ